MDKYYAKLKWILFFCLMGALLVFVANGDRQLIRQQTLSSGVILNAEETSAPLQTVSTGNRRALILYSPEDSYSVKYEKNLRIALEHLRIDSVSLELNRTESVSYTDYDLVILASSRIESEMTDPISRLLDYVEKGGALFWGILPDAASSQFQRIYRKLGIIDYGNYVDYNSLFFTEELVPGISQMSFDSSSFSDVGLSLTLEDRATVYAVFRLGEREIPLIWNYQTGNGSVTFYNGTGITGDFWRGIAAGCVNTLFDSSMYPIINAMCLFLDDFPSPQYESTSDVVRKTYNRSVKEFYRDIWWPDMQVAAQKYNDVYTGLFVATYNDIVDPEAFTYEGSSMEQYYGNSLLKGGYEMGAHGYNHQSLTLAGGTPDSMGYNPWANTADMAFSIHMLEDITAQLFPSVSYQTYVPPSNYLSAEGREAVKEALPGLKIISGIYTDEGEEGSVYVQDFRIAEDGVAEFPRITAGMLPEDFDTFSAISAMGLYGVFSHFIHPDDIFDEERGQNQTWETLYESYGELISSIHEKYPFLRSLSASEAADALMVSDSLVPHLDYQEDQILGSCENFYGEAFFYLRTEKSPKTVDQSCTVQKIDSENGSLYYLVTVKEPNFTIKLVDS
ncbi:MAG: DUF2194 domain-containing protein [Candidatus Limivivens sp.]|nr:DUF2194 domain-containing protein [Candidatus Limivivens sp.]